MKVQFLSIACVLILLLSSCEQKSEMIIHTPGERTVLVYFAADNNLSRYVQYDIDEMMEGMKEYPLSVSQHLLVYVDKGGEAHLSEITNRGGEICEEVIKIYPDRNSTGLAETQEVFNDVFGNPAYMAESYGLVYWSHAEGWIPYPLPSTRWIGQDTGQGSQCMNLSEFKQLLEGAPHFDFILFDACFMQSIEVAYELRNYADYYIASPTETPGTGAPYDAILPYMFKKGMAERLAGVYFNVYNESYNPEIISDSPWTMGAAICVLETAQLEALADATREALQSLEIPSGSGTLTTVLRQNIFDYDKRSSSLHIGYYDLPQIMQRLTEADGYEAWQQAYDRAVVYWETTPTVFSSFVRNFSMQGTNGVSHYLPSSPDVEACEPYHSLEWYEAAGISKMGW